MSDVRFNTIIRTWATSLLCAGAALAAPARVAVLVEPAGHGVPLAVSLAEATLGGDVALVERLAIDRVLAEQRDATALGNGDGSVRLGRLLSADVLAAARCDDPAAGPTGLVVFDAATGARLWDAALPTDPTAAADAMATAIRASVAKRALPPDRRRTACLFAVRNADLPRAQDAFCDAVGRLVERRLTGSPDVAVLERARLDRVTAERALPTADPADNRLLASVVLIQLDVSHGDRPGEVRLTAVLTDNGGKQLGTATVAPSADAEAIASSISDAICRQLRATLPRVAPDTRAEARRFAGEAAFDLDHWDHPAALRAAEAAHALDPDSVPIMAALARARFDMALDGTIDRTSYGRALSRDLFGSGMEQLEAAARRASAGGVSPVAEPQLTAADAAARRYVAELQMPHAARFKRPPPSPSDPAEAYRRFWLEVMEPLSFDAVRDAPSYGAYARQLEAELGDTTFSTAGDAGTDRWPADLLAALHRWAPLAVRFPKPLGQGRPWEEPERSVLDRLATYWTLPTVNVDGTVLDHPAWTAADLDGWQALFTTLATGDGAVGLTGRKGTRWVGQARAVLDAGGDLMQFPSVSGFIWPSVGRPATPRATPSTRPVHRSTADAHTVMPFRDVRPLADLTAGTSEVGCLAAPVVHGRSVYAVATVRGNGGEPYRQLFRYDLDAPPGTPPARLGTAPRLSSRHFDVFRNGGDRQARSLNAFFATVTQRASVDGDAYWVTSASRVDAFPLAGGPTRSFDPSAMPAPNFVVTAALDGHLYAAVGEDRGECYLVDQYLASGSVRTRASARRAEKLSPFDAGPPFGCDWMAADGPRHRLVFFVRSRLWDTALGGLWEYKPASGQFRQLWATPVERRPANARPADILGSTTPATVGPVVDGRVTVFGSGAFFAYDLAADRAETLANNGSGLQAPFAPAGGWVYGGFGRFIPGHPGDAQHFPALRTGEPYTSGSPYVPAHVLPVDAEHLVVGDALGLWLVTVPKP